MKRMLLVLLAGGTAGVLAYFGSLQLRLPAQPGDLNAPLAWMQADLELSPAQFARIKALHEQSGPLLHALEVEVARLRDELTAFEHARLASGQVDFLAFARFVEQRRSVDRACLESTRELIQAASAVMTPEQRNRFLARLEPLRPGSAPHAVN